MIDNYGAVYAIERALDTRPFCSCGRTISPVAGPDGIWVECASLRDARAGRLSRFIAALGAGTHTRELVVDLPALST